MCITIARSTCTVDSHKELIKEKHAVKKLNKLMGEAEPCSVIFLCSYCMNQCNSSISHESI